MDSDPIARFKKLLAEAEQLGIRPHNAAAFATTGKDLQPTVRMLLLKSVDESSFVFYTNLQSRKGRQLTDNPRASACFWWSQLARQVRIEGHIELVSDREADEYFTTRPRGSQIGAWASPQSSELSSRDELVTAASRWRHNTPGGRFRARRTGPATGWCPSASISGESSLTVCTSARSTRAKRTAGKSRCWRRDRRD